MRTIDAARRTQEAVRIAATRTHGGRACAHASTRITRTTCERAKDTGRQNSSPSGRAAWSMHLACEKDDLGTAVRLGVRLRRERVGVEHEVRKEERHGDEAENETDHDDDLRDVAAREALDPSARPER